MKSRIISPYIKPELIIKFVDEGLNLDINKCKIFIFTFHDIEVILKLNMNEDTKI